MKKIVLSGATGLIGRALVKALLKSNYKVVAIVRNPLTAKNLLPSEVELVKWDFKSSNINKEFLENSFSIIHLAGAGVFAKRWNEAYKSEIYSSRVHSTKLLVNLISELKQKPESLVVSSAVGYYGNRKDEILKENSEAGKDFLAKVCVDWEKEAAKVQQYGVRWVSIRTGIVLSTEDGALKKMLTPFKLFIGGPLGNGKQWFPWIHIDDIVDIYKFSVENQNCIGAFNAAAPQLVTMKEFSKILGKILKRPSILNVPDFVLKIVIGEAASDILSSQKINSDKIIELGYRFKFPILFDALRDLLHN